VKTTGDEKVLKRPGIPMTEEALKEWQKAFTDIEESIEQMELEEEKKNPYSKYLRMKQQSLF
jgi:hypothetical protein